MLERMHLLMKNILPVVLLLALSGVPALAQNNQGQNNQGQNNQGQNNQGGGGVRGAPGPLIGAGLPVLLVGGGIYWLVRRRKRA
jgi:LPXTG-motif cell wall-anchored protein